MGSKIEELLIGYDIFIHQQTLDIYLLIVNYYSLNYAIPQLLIDF